MAEPLVSVIDDDDSMRASLDSLLRSCGFRVAGFASAEAFLDSPERTDSDCIVSDICLPGGMSGVELVQLLSELGGAAPIILISATEKESGHPAAFCFLQKPFCSNTLLDCVHKALTA